MDDSQLKCTVIIPTYNRSRLLGHTLSSLAQQTLAPGEFEVIVADDGSSDDSQAVAESYRDRLQLSYFFQPDEGFRVAAARNIGIRHARAQVCVFLDCGMLAHPHFLAEHVATQTGSDLPLAVVGYNYGHKQDDEGTWELEAEVDVSDPAAAIEKLAAKPQWQDIREPFYAKYTDEFHDLPAPWLIYWSANISALTEQVRAVGMFDEQFRSWGAEDMDLGYRLHRDGARFVLNRRATAIHLPHSKDAEVNGKSSSGNYRYMAAKYGTPITALLPSFPVINPYTMNDVIRERGLPSCAAYLAARHLPAQGAPAAGRPSAEVLR
jgi:glycosyltransferase involved in cell wall biosynthesis